MAIVSVTRFQLRSARFVPAFALHAMRTIRQIRHSPGYMGGGVRRDKGLALWTMSVWRDESTMLAYVRGGAHLKAMPRLASWGRTASTVRWSQDGEDMPNWAEAERRMRADGRPIRLPHGDAGLKVSFPPAEGTFTARL